MEEAELAMRMAGEERHEGATAVPASRVAVPAAAWVVPAVASGARSAVAMAAVVTVGTCP